MNGYVHAFVGNAENIAKLRDALNEHKISNMLAIKKGASLHNIFVPSREYYPAIVLGTEMIKDGHIANVMPVMPYSAKTVEKASQMPGVAIVNPNSPAEKLNLMVNLNNVWDENERG